MGKKMKAKIIALCACECENLNARNAQAETGVLWIFGVKKKKG